MKAFKFHLAVLLICSFISLRGQDKQKTILLFYINEANINGVDYTETYVNAESYIVFYMSLSDSVLVMANVRSLNKTQSFGNLKPYEITTNNEPYDSLNTQRSYYKWNYSNSYDDDKGTSHVELIQMIKNGNKYFVLKIFTDQYGVCVYKGYSYDLFSGLITETK